MYTLVLVLCFWRKISLVTMKPKNHCPPLFIIIVIYTMFYRGCQTVLLDGVPVWEVLLSLPSTGVWLLCYQRVHKFMQWVQSNPENEALTVTQSSGPLRLQAWPSCLSKKAEGMGGNVQGTWVSSSELHNKPAMEKSASLEIRPNVRS